MRNDERVTGIRGRTVKRYCASCAAPVYVRPDSADAWGDSVRCAPCAGGGQLAALRYHVSGAVARGELEPIVGIPADPWEHVRKRS